MIFSFDNKSYNDNISQDENNSINNNKDIIYDETMTKITKL